MLGALGVAGFGGTALATTGTAADFGAEVGLAFEGPAFEGLAFAGTGFATFSTGCFETFVGTGAFAEAVGGEATDICAFVMFGAFEDSWGARPAETLASAPLSEALADDWASGLATSVARAALLGIEGLGAGARLAFALTGGGLGCAFLTAAVLWIDEAVAGCLAAAFFTTACVGLTGAAGFLGSGLAEGLSEGRADVFAEVFLGGAFFATTVLAAATGLSALGSRIAGIAMDLLTLVSWCRRVLVEARADKSGGVLSLEGARL